MTLQTSGPISFTNIVDEFGSAPTKSISNYYGLDSGIPNSGPIKFSDFYGKLINATRTIIATRNFNARNDFTNASIVGGYKSATTVFSTNQKVKYYLTVNGIIDSANTSTTAFDTGTFPSGSFLYLTNNSYIVGAGGAGGSSNGAAGGAGGPALTLRLTTYITNRGTIAGGGGGGGSGGYGYSNYCIPRSCFTQDCYTDTSNGGGGGGGAGGVPGAKGSGGNPGTDGTYFTGGTGGSGSNSGRASSGTGGNGGDLGSPGTNGTDGNGGSGGSRGAAGNYIVNNNLATWVVTGTVLGGAA